MHNAEVEVVIRRPDGESGSIIILVLILAQVFYGTAIYLDAREVLISGQPLSTKYGLMMDTIFAFQVAFITTYIIGTIFIIVCNYVRQMMRPEPRYQQDFVPDPWYPRMFG